MSFLNKKTAEIKFKLPNNMVYRVILLCSKLPQQSSVVFHLSA